MNQELNHESTPQAQEETQYGMRKGVQHGDRRHIAMLFLIAIVVIGILFAGHGIQSSAWNQGYTLGLLTGGGDTAEITSYLLYRSGPGGGMGGGSVFGKVIGLGLMLLAGLAALRYLAFGRHNRLGGPPQWMRYPGYPFGETPAAADETPPAESSPMTQSPPTSTS